MPPEAFEIDPDIRRAQTPPAAFYRDADWFAACRERVFARSWLLLELPRCASSDAQLWPFTLLPGCLDEPLLLSKTAAGPRCLSNVCTHRGATMLERPTESQAIRCSYHGRCFDLEGRVLQTPCFENAEDYPGPTDHLAEVDLHTWRGFSFASLAPDQPLQPALDAIEARLGFWLEGGLPAQPSDSTSYRFAANWALYVDNYSEGFHIPYLHPGLAPGVDFGAYRSELFPGGSLQIGFCQRPEDAFALPAGHPDAGQLVGGYYFFLHPCTMLNFYPWGLSINLLRPRGPQQTELLYQSYVREPERRGTGLGRDLDQVEREDQAVLLRCQRGLAGRLYQRGRYAPEQELGTHAFHRRLAEQLFA